MFPQGNIRGPECFGGETSPPPYHVVAPSPPEQLDASTSLISGTVAALGMLVAQQPARWSSSSTTRVSPARRCESSASERMHETRRSEDWCSSYSRGVISLSLKTHLVEAPVVSCPVSVR